MSEACPFNTDSPNRSFGRAPAQTNPRPLQPGGARLRVGWATTRVREGACVHLSVGGVVPVSVFLCVRLRVRPMVCWGRGLWSLGSLSLGQGPARRHSPCWS